VKNMDMLYDYEMVETNIISQICSLLKRDGFCKRSGVRTAEGWNRCFPVLKC
jgi:hypothetical protein